MCLSFLQAILVLCALRHRLRLRLLYHMHLVHLELVVVNWVWAPVLVLACQCHRIFHWIQQYYHYHQEQFCHRWLLRQVDWAPHFSFSLHFIPSNYTRACVPFRCQCLTHSQASHPLWNQNQISLLKDTVRLRLRQVLGLRWTWSLCERLVFLVIMN